jgi:hypothetical protein
MPWHSGHALRTGGVLNFDFLIFTFDFEIQLGSYKNQYLCLTLKTKPTCQSKNQPATALRL